MKSVGSARAAWRPIGSAPKDGSLIILASDGGVAWLGHWAEAIGWTRYNCRDVGWCPDWWKPRPMPPKQRRPK